MSAIAGILSQGNKPLAPGQVTSMLTVMARRGPDASGEWAQGEISLGHGALHSTSSAMFEPQPAVDDRRGLTIVADVRLDNRQELISDLALKRTNSHPIGDAAILLAAYQRWGTDFPARLLGDFAFAIWDGNEHQLVLGRDHFGARPLMYYASNEVFAFASDARAIVGLEGVPRAPNRSRMIDLIVDEIEAVDIRNTFFEGVFRVPPATTLTVQQDRVREHTYWRLEEPPILRLESSAAYEEALRETLGEAVRTRMQGQHAVGTLLSGGIDSATVVALSAEYQTPRTFSATTDDVECVETRLINETVAHLGADATFVQPRDVPKLIQPFDRFLADLDNPFVAVAFPVAAYEAARRVNMKSMLSGIFADEVFGVSIRQIMSIALRQRRPAAFLSAAMSPGNERAFHGSLGISRLALGSIAEHVGVRQPPGPRQRATTALADYEERLHLRLDEEDRAALLKRLEIHHGGASQLPSAVGVGAHRKQLFACGYAAAALERYDRFGAHCGIEVRSPYLDRRVIELALSLPFDQLGHQGYSKSILRRSMTDLLPQPVLWNKTKAHVGWRMMSHWFTDEHIERVSCSPARELIDSVVDVDALLREARRHSERTLVAMLSTIQLMYWLEGAMIREV